MLTKAEIERAIRTVRADEKVAEARVDRIYHQLREAETALVGTTKVLNVLERMLQEKPEGEE